MTPRRLDQHNKKLRDLLDIRDAFRQWSLPYQDEPWFDTLDDFMNRMYNTVKNPKPDWRSDEKVAGREVERKGPAGDHQYRRPK